MRKLSVFLLFCLLVTSFCLYAQDEVDEAEVNHDIIKYEDPFKDAPKKKSAMLGRVFELGFDLNVFLGNDFFAFPDFFHETVIVDLGKLSNGLKLDLGIGLIPFYFMIDSKKGWGFGVSTNVDVFGMLDLNEIMLSIGEGADKMSSAGGSAFVSAGIDTFFHISKFKVKLRPAVYYSAAYVKADASYSLNDYNGKTRAGIDFDVRIYTAFPMNDLQLNALTGTPGVDLSFGLEFPLSKEIGINSSIFDFDIGLDLYNIPIFSSTLRNYKRIQGNYGNSEGVNIVNDWDGFINSMESNYSETDGEETFSVERPFIALFHVNWRPGGRETFVINPVFGFSLNNLYSDPFNLEAGVNLRLNLGNVLITALGVNYTDRAWSNSLNFSFNLRLLEISIGAMMRSVDFIKSWTGHGIGVNLGLKLGW